ncbi:MAG: hypothetical protein Q9160_005216 [Pyrenula sp. 1 TL-2023]
MTSDGYPSETSPLLTGQENGIQKANGVTENGSIAEVAPSLGSDIERRSSRDTARDVQFTGIPEAFQGIGGGGMTTVVSIMLSDIVPLKERGLWQGILNIVFASGAACGAPLGGVFADHIGWRWAFFFQVPLCLIAFVVVLLYLNLPRKDSSDWRTNLKRIDFLGAFFLVLAVFSLLLGLDRGSNEAWSLPISYGPLIGSIVLSAIFVLVETRYAAEPFAPGHIIFNRSLFASYACNFFSFAAAMSALYYLPLFFQAVNGSNATGAGLRLLPATFSGVCGSLFGGWYMKKTGRYYWITAIFYWGMAFGLFLVILFTGVVTVSYPGLIVAMICTFFSNGVGVTTTLIALLRNAAPEDQAIATACSYLFRSLGSVVGIALGATTVQQSLRAFLGDALRHGKDADAIVEGVRQSLEFIDTLEPALRAIVRHCYDLAIRNGFGFMFGVSIFSALFAFMITEKTLE